MTKNNSITDKFVSELCRTTAAIQIALWNAEPDSALHRGLVGRLDQMDRAWAAFQGDVAP